VASRSSEVNFTKNYMLLLYSRRGPIRTDVSSFDSGSELIAFSGGAEGIMRIKREIQTEAGGPPSSCPHNRVHLWPLTHQAAIILRVWHV